MRDPFASAYSQRMIQRIEALLLERGRSEANDIAFWLELTESRVNSYLRYMGDHGMISRFTTPGKTRAAFEANAACEDICFGRIVDFGGDKLHQSTSKWTKGSAVRDEWTSLFFGVISVTTTTSKKRKEKK